MKSLQVFTFMVVATCYSYAQQTEITVRPRNTVFVAGEPNPVLECEMTYASELDGIQWVEYRTDPTQGYAISLNESIFEGSEEFYRIQNEFHLELLNPDVTAGAKYECRNLLAPQSCTSAQVAILASGLQSETNASEVGYTVIAGEAIRFECWVEHSGGDWIPEIFFDNSQGGIEDESFDCRIPADGENVVRQCVDIVIDPVNGDWLYSCEVRFPAPPIPDDPICTADRLAPDFAVNFTFPALEVHWAPRNMVMTPANGSYVQAGDILSCSAESSPPPSFYQWFDSELEVIDINSATIVVPPECEGIDELCVTCLALNEMRGGVLGQGEIYHCYNSTVPLKTKSHLPNERKATCWNPERTKLRKPAVYNHQTVDAFKNLIESQAISKRVSAATHAQPKKQHRGVKSRKEGKRPAFHN